MTGQSGRGLVYRSFGVPGEVLSLEDPPPGPPEPPGEGRIAVRMILAPVNPSDLIPITGAYRHRIALPAVAGYEGVGRVVAAGPGAGGLVGRRVLPLRGEGTWQTVVVCDAAWAVPVPDGVDDALAARAYINPLAAHLMLRRWPVGGRSVLLTAAGSACALLLAQWALRRGARRVFGVTDGGAHDGRLRTLGVRPVRAGDRAAVAAAAGESDVVFDAVGGDLATAILTALRPGAVAVSYGALSGRPAEAVEGRPPPQRFHLRDGLGRLTPEVWQGWFRDLWGPLRDAELPDVTPFPLARWRDALAFFARREHASKPVLAFEDEGGGPHSALPADGRRP